MKRPARWRSASRSVLSFMSHHYYHYHFLWLTTLSIMLSKNKIHTFLQYLSASVSQRLPGAPLSTQLNTLLYYTTLMSSDISCADLSQCGKVFKLFFVWFVEHFSHGLFHLKSASSYNNYCLTVNSLHKSFMVQNFNIYNCHEILVLYIKYLKLIFLLVFFAIRIFNLGQMHSKCQTTE